MTVSVAEYLGVNVSTGRSINPNKLGKGSSIPCPFREGSCDKIIKGNKPICSVRDGSDQIWIVCEHRLCATSPKRAALTRYQTDVLMSIANTIWAVDIDPTDVAVRREVPVRTTGRSPSSADYVMIPTPSLRSRYHSAAIGPVVLEMQGGGETTNTGALTKQIEFWEQLEDASSRVSELTRPVSSVGTLETNAWRRQQEQFLYKGSVAVNSFGRLVFVVGAKLYDYLLNNLAGTVMKNLSGANWTLALIGISESQDESGFGTADSIRLAVDSDRLLFTSYMDFVQALTRQGGIDPDLFRGDFTDLSGQNIIVD
jgi:hypothetical protein